MCVCVDACVGKIMSTSNLVCMAKSTGIIRMKIYIWFNSRRAALPLGPSEKDGLRKKMGGEIYWL